MMLDKANLFSNAQSIAAVASTVLGDYSVDLGASATDSLGNTVPSDLAKSMNELLVTITETVTSGGAATIDFQLVMADNAALTTNKVVLQTTGAIALATLAAGYKPRLGMPQGGFTKRYLGIQYVIATATTTAGKVTAGLVPCGHVDNVTV